MAKKTKKQELLESLDAVINDCQQMVDANNGHGSIEEDMRPWDVHDVDNWESMLTCLEKVKKELKRSAK